MSLTRYAAMVRRSRLPAIVVTTSLLTGACGGQAATQAPAGVQLVNEAAVSATIGADGGELTAADPARGRSYRVLFPAGAFPEDTRVTATPIAAIDAFPLDGGFLGGVDLGPSGVTFLGPVSLEIGLDLAQQVELRSAIDAGQAIVGIEYPAAAASGADELAMTPADVAADLSTVTVQLFSFSGHVAGKASPGNLASRPCPSDPAKHAQCEISKILHPPGGPGDLADPAIRGQIANVLRDWLDELEVVLDTSTDDPADYRAAVSEAITWNFLASRYRMASDLWYGSGDELEFEGRRLEDAVFRAYTAGLDLANRACPADGTVEFVLEWIDFRELADALDIPLPPYSALAALAPGTFCVAFTLDAELGPAQLAEGNTSVFSFAIRSLDNLLTTEAQLARLSPKVNATPADRSLLSSSGDRQGMVAVVNVAAIRAIPGNTAEGAFEVELRLFGLPVAYAAQTASFDITSTGPTPTAPPPPIVCTGSPAKVTTGADSAWAMVRYDGGSACDLVANRTDDDDPNAILAMDLDPGDSGWDAHDGANWTREGSGVNNPPGTYHIRVRHDQSGRWYIVTLTAEVVTTSGGSGGTMTVRDVSIAVEP